MAAIDSIISQTDYFSFSGNLTCIKRDETNKFPFLKNMVESKLKGNCIDNVYYITFDINHFMYVYNYVILGIKPKPEDYDMFSKIYKYIFCGKEVKNIKKVEKIKKIKKNKSNFETLYEAFNSDNVLFKKLAHKHFISDDISLTSNVIISYDFDMNPIYNGSLKMCTQFGEFNVANRTNYGTQKFDLKMFSNENNKKFNRDKMIDKIVGKFSKDKLVDKFGIKYVFEKYCIAIEKYLSKKYTN
jgi:hypothetical protein